MSAIVEFNNVWEKYRIKFIKEGKVSWEEVWALSDVNFKVEKGEVLGVIGENGAGKTTLLKLIAGMIMPDTGSVSVNGKVSALMELGAGFNPEFTGRENIMLNARIYGLEENILQQQMEKIIDFADIGKFIDAPVKYYSQGMFMRLAFSLAIFVDPDVLLIDDILAVGDAEAQQKCIKKIFELKELKKTIVIVSHDMNMINRLCGHVILIEKGRLTKEGCSSRVVSSYLEKVGNKEGIAVLENDKIGIVFNNGRINISYGGSPLTKGYGGSVTVFMHKFSNWLSSANLLWKIKECSNDVIIAEGYSLGGLFRQVWKITFQEDGLKLKIDLLLDEETKEPHLDLFLVPQYNKWHTQEKEGNFPPYMHKTNWQDLGINCFSECIAGVSSEQCSHDLPALVLETEDKDSQIRFFNSGYEQEARIVQVLPSINDSISFNLKIFTD